MRLAGLLDRRGLTGYRLAKASGMTPGHVSNVLTGKRPITREFLEKFSQVSGHDIDELLAWLDAERLGAEGLDRLGRWLGSVTQAPDGGPSPGPQPAAPGSAITPTIDLPFFGQVGCGPLLEPEETSRETRLVRRDLVDGSDLADLAVVEAKGDSMASAGIHDSDLLVVRRQNHAEVGQVVIANLAHLGSTCKRLAKDAEGRFVLVADSPTYHTPIRVTDGVSIVGRVLSKYSERAF